MGKITKSAYKPKKRIIKETKHHAGFLFSLFGKRK